jgi:hypothetical protein
LACDRWTFVNYDGQYHGRDAAAVRAADADVFNLSGGSCSGATSVRILTKFYRPDPTFTQLPSQGGCGTSRSSNASTTFGSNIGTTAGYLTGAFTWHKNGSRSPSTTGPICRPAIGTRPSTWQIESFTDVGGNKDQEFEIHRPRRERASS